MLLAKQRYGIINKKRAHGGGCRQKRFDLTDIDGGSDEADDIRETDDGWDLDDDRGSNDRFDLDDVSDRKAVFT